MLLYFEVSRNKVPIWEKYITWDTKIIQRKYKIIKKNIEPILQKDDKIEDFYLPSTSNPDKFKRWFLLLVYDLKYGIKLSNKLSTIIKNINC